MTDGDRPPAPDESTTMGRARLLVGRASADDGVPDPEAALQRVCRAAVGALSMGGAVIHLGSVDGVVGVVASSDDASRLIAELAFTTGEGPTIDAFAYRRPVLVSDLARDPRQWPGYTHVASQAGVLAVWSLPLQIGGVMLGVLALHSERERSLTDGDLDLAVAFTQVAALALLGELPEMQQAGPREPLLDHRAEVHQAQGMVMVDLGVDLAEALLRMRAHAFSEGLALVDLAIAIIGGLVLPAVDGDQA